MTERPLSRILHRLAEAGCRPILRGGSWQSLCPAHDDRRPSLWLREGEDATALLRCHAGCRTERILEKLGLGWKDLFADGHEPRKGSPRQQRQAQKPGDPLTWWAERSGVPKEWLERLPIEEGGDHIRFRFGNLPTAKARAPGSKGFWLVRDAETGEWRPKAPDDGAQMPPFWPLPPDHMPPVAVVTEGESDVCVVLYAIEGLGLGEKAAAISVTQGAGQRPTPEAIDALIRRGCRALLLVPDVDQAGQDFARGWAEAARQRGLGVAVLDLLAEGLADPLRAEKDARDAFRRQPTKTMAALKETIEALAQAEAPNFTSDIIPPVVGSKVPTAAELRAEAPKEFPWLPVLGQEGFIWEGSVALLSGYPKVGKSTFLTWVMLEWAAAGRRVHVLTEEGLEVWRRRLSAMPDGPWERVTVQPALGLGIEGLCQALRDVDADIFVVDTLRKVAPLGSFRDTAEVNAAFVSILSAHQEAQARRGGPVTLVLSHHDRKSSEGAEEGQRVADSHVIFGSVDTILELVREEGNRRLLRGWGRLVEPPTVIIEMAEDGALRILGSPQDVALEEVKGKVLGALQEVEGWLKTKEVREALPTPRPSDDQVRRALLELARKGLVERAPPLSEGTRQGVTYRWRLAPGQPNFTSDEGGCNSGSKVAPAPCPRCGGEAEALRGGAKAQCLRCLLVFPLPSLEALLAQEGFEPEDGPQTQGEFPNKGRLPEQGFPNTEPGSGQEFPNRPPEFPNRARVSEHDFLNGGRLSERPKGVSEQPAPGVSEHPAGVSEHLEGLSEHRGGVSEHEVSERRCPG